ncbi:RNA recognition motif domain-containing protein [Streptomyces anulatus]|uniref:RNA recognition motif domain-containing protein n=1 Tax=Streptomyces anulatus TaxID=1892 RepID=UPI0036A16E01
MTATVYVSNLNWSTTDDSLREAASRSGVILDSVVDRDPETGRSKRTGSITFSEDHQAQGAIAALDGQTLDGSRIRASLNQDDTSSNDSDSGFGGSVGGSIGGYGGSVGGSIGNGGTGY